MIVTNHVYATLHAKRGWRVLPVASINNGRCTCSNPECDKPGKHPRIRDWRLNATTELRDIALWWMKWPNASVGIATGAPGPVVLDVDTRHGGDKALAALIKKHGKLPKTVEVATGGGGKHYYFAAPIGFEIKNSASKVGAGLDIRGTGGFIVAPPSNHISGGSYSFRKGHNTADVELAQIPLWLLEMIRTPTGNRQAMAKPPAEWRGLFVDDAREGNRNARLASLTGHLLRQGIDAYVVLELAKCWNLVHGLPPLDEVEVHRVVESIVACEVRRRGTAKAAK